MLNRGPTQPEPDYGSADPAAEQKLAELILYVAQKCAGDDTFGATKLNKVLFFSDFLSYRYRGTAITGVRYMKLDNGPAPQILVPVRNNLISSNFAEEVSMVFRGRLQKRLVAKRPADLSMFSADDIALVDEVIDDLRGQTAREVSRLSHRMAWKVAEDDQGLIPYQASLLSDREPKPSDFDWSRQMIQEIDTNG